MLNRQLVEECHSHQNISGYRDHDSLAYSITKPVSVVEMQRHLQGMVIQEEQVPSLHQPHQQILALDAFADLHEDLLDGA